MGEFMRIKLAIALAASFGGIAPNLLQLALGLVRQERTVPVLNSGYVFGLLLLAALGAGVAIIWGEKVPKRAFYLGVGLPAMLQVALNGGAASQAAGKGDKPDKKSEFYLFAAPAYAEPLPQPPAADEPEKQAGKTMQITYEVTAEGSPPKPPTYDLKRNLNLKLKDLPRGTQLIISSADGTVSSKVDLPSTDKKIWYPVKLPDFAATISLRADTLASGTYKLDPNEGSQTSYKVELDSKFFGGLLKALGVGNAKPYEFEVHKLTEAAPKPGTPPNGGR